VSRYGVIKGGAWRNHLFHLMDLVEKPDVAEAPSDLAIIGRYILTPNIFSVWRPRPRTAAARSS